MADVQPKIHLPWCLAHCMLVVEVWLTPYFLSRCPGLGALPTSPSFRRLSHTPSYNWAVEDDHGSGTACLVGADGKPHCPTIFPTLSIVAASFNESLWEQIGTVIGSEMRAANNVGGTRARHPTMVSHTYIGTADLPPLCFSPQRVISIWFGPAPVTIS